MKRILVFGSCVLLAVLCACTLPTDTAKSVKSKLKYTNFPSLPGTTWTGSGVASSITKWVTTPGSNSSEVDTTIPLKNQSSSLTFSALTNGSGTFTLVNTYSYDANFDSTLVSDDQRYSTSSTYYSSPGLDTSTIYTEYSTDHWYGRTVGTTALGSKYNGRTVYPVTYTSHSNYSGKSYQVDTYTGTYRLSSASDPLDASGYPVMTFTSVVSVTTNYNTSITQDASAATPTTSTTTTNYLASISPAMPKFTQAVDTTGKTIYILTDMNIGSTSLLDKLEFLSYSKP
jgi:hypothetical protein